MPGGDRTGPVGMGPMTGRAAGFCAGFPSPGYANPVSGRGFFRRGRGFWGRGGGRGRGFGRGFGWARAGYGFAAAPSPEQGLEGLKRQAQYLQSSLDDINKQIDELQKEKTE